MANYGRNHDGSYGYNPYTTDPLVLGAQARAVAQRLHEQGDVIVRFKTNESGYREDELDQHDKEAPGHFRSDKNVITINLDETLPSNKPRPTKLDSIEDFRQYPILAGVLAHESGHARWTQWGVFDNPGAWPKALPNPDFDPAKPEGKGNRREFPLDQKGGGELFKVAKYLEEPRIDRLASNVFTKTWKRAIQLVGGHLILKSVQEQDEAGENAVDAALGMAIIVGARMTIGVLGTTPDERAAVKKVLESAKKIIELNNEQLDPSVQTKDAFEEIMAIVNRHTFSSANDDPIEHLEAARQILAIVHPEKADDPDQSGDEGEGDQGSASAAAMPGAGTTASKSGDDEGDDSDQQGGGDQDEDDSEGDDTSEDADGSGDGAGEDSGNDNSEAEQAMQELRNSMKEELDELADKMGQIARVEAENNSDKGTNYHGAVMFRDPKAPPINRYEDPTAEDRDLYKRIREWMFAQIEPTRTLDESQHWLPGGGARLDVQQYIRDNLAGNIGPQRSDWKRVSETVKPAPPVKVAIMLDGSGSMNSYARKSASIAWAAANAAADLPESRTVSVIYGDAAGVTQEPGHMPSKKVAVASCNGGMEEFQGAARLVEEHLWLNDEVEEDAPSNVLIIIVSDICYGGEAPDGEHELKAFERYTKDWAERGYKIVILGAENGLARKDYRREFKQDYYGGGYDADAALARGDFEFAKQEDLFR
jgi:hypothetical protein